jgi:hypothetical protein
MMAVEYSSSTRGMVTPQPPVFALPASTDHSSSPNIISGRYQPDMRAWSSIELKTAPHDVPFALPCPRAAARKEPVAISRAVTGYSSLLARDSVPQNLRSLQEALEEAGVAEEAWPNRP